MTTLARRGSSATLAEALTAAQAFWDASPGDTRMMPIRARQCVAILGEHRKLDTLTAADGTTLLAALGKRGLARSTVQSTLAAFKRMVELQGRSLVGWPKAPKLARIKRTVHLDIDPELIRRVLYGAGWEDTALLVSVLAGSGMRVHEALGWDTTRLLHNGCLEVTGKGGHVRHVPMAPYMLSIMIAKDALSRMRVTPYSTHYARLQKVAPGVGFHDFRRWYATQAYKRSGKNLKAVQELLGHADISTTALYVGVDEAELRRAAYDA